MITHGIREFMNRDWNAARDSKDAYWGARIARLGAGEGLRIADELRRQALAHDPTWPHPDERREDLACHARLAAQLRRAGTTRSR